MNEPVISLFSINKQYTRSATAVTALRDLTLPVAKGEFCALEGPSGCGKTTALLVAGGLLRPDSGTVTVGGKDLYALDSGTRTRFRARRIGFVFQQFHLVPYLSALDNIRLPGFALGDTNGGARAQDLARRFDLTDRLGHRPSELSTGERQRVALARALFNAPDCILADEPTGNLDDNNAQAVLSSLRDFASEGGAVLLVTHDARARSFADRTMRMERGELKVEQRG